MVANGKRSIKSGSQYTALIDTTGVTGGEVSLMDGSVYDTLGQMQSIVSKTLPETEKIAKRLKGTTLKETCRNIFNFLYNHVQYKKDHDSREQLRTPARTWKDRTSGVDCDCYSIFISSVLTNLNIPHAFRMAGYKGDFQHVYVVVPVNGKAVTSVRSSYYVIDPVVNQFDYEEKFTKKHDKMNITMLNGLGECTPQKPTIEMLRRYTTVQNVIQNGMVPTELLLDSLNIPWTAGINEGNNSGYFMIQTTGGMVKLPTVLSKEDADKLKSSVPNNNGDCACPSSMFDKILAALKKIKWWWWVVGAGSVLLLSSGKKGGVSGLNGPPKFVQGGLYGKRKKKRLSKKPGKQKALVI